MECIINHINKFYKNKIIVDNNLDKLKWKEPEYIDNNNCVNKNKQITTKDEKKKTQKIIIKNIINNIINNIELIIKMK